ncbi:hypothetical protein K1T71_001587 [Dendrolimus kikuchii]|uniref:Uncharacterized protein n=1 Tax=Dendrolimus kikuchii TaxID=765133 RepID=A0ACC1DF16_9NEOP|nr:hypothetical protein K1T71_001587 [Dendrolimus kikuchii]
MDRRMEETVSRWVKEELDEDDLIESEQEEDVREEENILHSPHDTDTEQEDQRYDNDENAEQNHSDSDNSMPRAFCSRTRDRSTRKTCSKCYKNG